MPFKLFLYKIKKIKKEKEIEQNNSVLTQEDGEANIRFQSTGDSSVSIFSLIHRYFWFKFFFFFFPYWPISFFWPKHTDIRPIRFDSVWIGANRPGSARIGVRQSWIGASWRESRNEKKKKKKNFNVAPMRGLRCRLPRLAPDSDTVIL